MQSIPYRNGAYDFGGDVAERVITIPLAFANATNRTDLQTKVRTFMAFLVDATSKPRDIKLQFDYELDKYYTARLSAEVDIERIFHTGEFELELTVFDPNAYATLTQYNEAYYYGIDSHIYDITVNDAPVKLSSNADGSVRDSFSRVDGVWKKSKRFEYVVLDGSLGWIFNADLTGYKRVIVPIPNPLVNTANAVKFNGKIITHIGDISTATGGDFCKLTSTDLWITISDTDSGWGESETVTSQMIKDYFDANPYQLQYQLATTETQTGEVVGELALKSGSNTVTLSTSIYTTAVITYWTAGTDGLTTQTANITSGDNTVVVAEDSYGYVTVYGRTLVNYLPSFSSGLWTLHPNATVVSPYESESVATGTFEISTYKFNAIPSQNHTFSISMDGVRRIYEKNAEGTIVFTHDWSASQTTSFTTQSTTKSIEVLLSNGSLGAGTFTFTNPQLELGSTANEFVANMKSVELIDIKVTNLSMFPELIYPDTGKDSPFDLVEYDTGLIYPNPESFEWLYASQFSTLYNYGQQTPFNFQIVGTVTNPKITNLTTGLVLNLPSITDQTLIVKADKYIVTKAGVNALKDITGDFIQLAKGDNQLQFEGSSPNATVTMQWLHKFL